MTDRALYFTAPRSLALRATQAVPPGAGQVRVRTLASAISPGTEMLIYKGEAPPDLAADDTLAALSGALAFPLKYGYACVGVVETLGDGVERGWLGRRVFAFNPHESAFVCAAAQLHPIPDDVSDDDALLLPNMESAVNFVMDGRPVIGERVAVIGQGVVGLLVTALLARMPLAQLVVFDRIAARRARGLALGATRALDPAEPPAFDADLCFELSGAPAALDSAIALCGYAGRIVIGSWYGTRRAPLDLGGRFHRSRIQLVSSQVSTLSPDLLARWDIPRRLAVAWEMLRAVRPAQLITHRIPFARAAEAYRMLDERPEDALQVVLGYLDA